MSLRNHLLRPGRLLAAVALLVTAFFSAALEPLKDWPTEAAASRQGGQAVRLYRAWIDLVRGIDKADEKAKLVEVNQFFNHRIQYLDDMTVWGQSDYWATPLEMFGKGAGDCEDFVIGKYLTLRGLGVSPEKLRLVYVKARIGGAQSSVTQAHMVLAYYTAPAAEPLILDNLVTSMLPASQRADLTPVFSFNAEGMWVGGASQNRGVERLSRWQELLVRARKEGFRF